MNNERNPAALPPFPRAVAVQYAAAKLGFDWPDITGVLDKVAEELEELRKAHACNDVEHMRYELGDLLFSAVSAARFLDEDPEVCVAKATNRFEIRMDAVKKLADAQGRNLETCSTETLDALWEQAKQLASQ